MSAKSIILLVVVAIGTSISRVNCPSPRAFQCRTLNRIAWSDAPPYAIVINTTYQGIVYDIFKEGMRRCCNKEPLYKHALVTSSQNDVTDFVANESVKYTTEFVLPVQREEKSKHFLEHPFVPIVISPGFAVFTKPGPDSLTLLFDAIMGVVPLFIITLIVVLIAGILFWLIENMTLASFGETPERFNPGVFNAMWWAFVTMSTVGYGDVVPRTGPGRVFNVFWVFAGVSMCAMVISAITSSLVSGLTPKEVKLQNQDVAVLQASQEYKYVFARQGNPLEFDRVPELAKALQKEQVSIALLDVHVASYYEEELKHFVLHRVIEFMTSNGVIILPNARKITSCVRQFLLDSQQDILSNISKNVKVAKWPSHEVLTNIMDPTSLPFRYFLITVIGILAFCTFCGVLKQWLEKKMVLKNKNKGRLNKREVDACVVERTSLYGIDNDKSTAFAEIKSSSSNSGDKAKPIEMIELQGKYICELIDLIKSLKSMTTKWERICNK